MAWRSPDLADSLQGICATFLCQPLDVVKTRLMNSHGEYQVSCRPCPPCCCLSSHLYVPHVPAFALPPHLSLSHSRVSSTVPWKLPSSGHLPSTRYLAGGAWRGAGWAELGAELVVQNSPGTENLPGSAVAAQLPPASGLCLPSPGLAPRYCKPWPQWDSVWAQAPQLWPCCTHQAPKQQCRCQRG